MKREDLVIGKQYVNIPFGYYGDISKCSRVELVSVGGEYVLFKPIIDGTMPYDVDKNGCTRHGLEVFLLCFQPYEVPGGNPIEDFLNAHDTTD